MNQLHCRNEFWLSVALSILTWCHFIDLQPKPVFIYASINGDKSAQHWWETAENKLEYSAYFLLLWTKGYPWAASLKSHFHVVLVPSAACRIKGWELYASLHSQDMDKPLSALLWFLLTSLAVLTDTAVFLPFLLFFPGDSGRDGLPGSPGSRGTKGEQGKASIIPGT